MEGRRFNACPESLEEPALESSVRLGFSGPRLLARQIAEGSCHLTPYVEKVLDFRPCELCSYTTIEGGAQAAVVIVLDGYEAEGL